MRQFKEEYKLKKKWDKEILKVKQETEAKKALKNKNRKSKEND